MQTKDSSVQYANIVSGLLQQFARASSLKQGTGSSSQSRTAAARLSLSASRGQDKWPESR
ncbi:MAG: hypothetical protein H6R10_1483 [Rhodocyclaceae bacterium]|nr:hypothetical protein [Rhodocyclaceae bacterium]